MLRNTRMVRIALAAAMLTSVRAVAQDPKPAPRLLSDDESRALMSAHSKSTNASPTKYKYHHRVTEVTMAQVLTSRIETFAIVPDKFLNITTMPGIGSSKTGYDGKVGWSESPGTGAILLEGEPLKALIAGIAPMGSFAAASPAASVPGAHIYAVGRETVDGRAANAFLNVNGADSSIIYFDAQSGLMSGMRVIRSGGQHLDTTMLMLFGDYKSLDGSMLPLKTTIRARGREFVTRIVEFDHKRINSAKFALPPAVRELVKRTP